METTVSRSIISKAERLIAAGKVIRLGPLRYKVQGDTDTYHVLLSYPQEASGRCTCPATVAPCSHLYAASVAELSRDIKAAAVEVWSRELFDPFDGLV